MEEAVVFGPIYLCGGCFCLLIIGFIVLIVYLIMRSKGQAWSGEVIEKVYNTKEEDDKTEHYYSLKTRMDSGKVSNIAVSSQFYDTVKVGDRIKKDKGSLYPVKVVAS